MIPMYEALEITKCKKCRKVIAETKRIGKGRLNGIHFGTNQNS